MSFLSLTLPCLHHSPYLTPRHCCRGVFMPERLHGETGDCNESNSPSSLVSHSANPRMGKIGTQEVFSNTALHIIRVIISATFRANSNNQRKPKDKLMILDGRIIFRVPGYIINSDLVRSETQGPLRAHQTQYLTTSYR